MYVLKLFYVGVLTNFCPKDGPLLLSFLCWLW